MEDFFDNELGRKILALVKAGFQVSDLISDLVLRDKIKHQVLNVYKIFFEKKYPELLKELDILNGFFFLAGHLNLTKEEHVKTLRNGLLVFKSQVILTMHSNPKIVVPEKETVPRAQRKKDDALNDRQEKIMKQFQNNQDLQLSDLVKHFPDVSERTIRNDLSQLIKGRKIIRRGNGSGSRYSAETSLEKRL